MRTRLLATALATALILACGGDDDDRSATPTATVAPATPTAAPTGDQTQPPDGTTPAPEPPQADAYGLEPVVDSGYLGEAANAAIALAPTPGSDDEAVIALQTGLLYRVSLSQAFAPQQWGDVSDLMPGVDRGNLGEQGLLSIAFSPGFAEDGRVYLYYTRGSPQPSVLSRFQATPGTLDIASEELLLEIPQFAANHNGGTAAFGHDGYLLLSLGDGGGGGDPQGHGQDPQTLLGSVLRIDVSGQSGYTIPNDNPFGNEVFAYGLRNPWRMSVDSATGDIWLGDVGQSAFEEVARVAIGENHGWNCYEGFAEYEFTDSCAGRTFAEPRAIYGRDFGRAVTGGAVYRGDTLPELRGWYVYGDFYTGRIWAANTADDSDPVHLTQREVNVASFSELPDGELAIVTYTDGVHLISRN